MARRGKARQGRAGNTNERNQTMTTQDILQNIYNTHGTLTPQLIIQDAKNPDHPLHNRFEWNNTKAAQQYRELQAAQLIRTIKITYQDTPQRQVRAFINIQPTGDELDTKGHYQPVDIALRNELTRKRIFETMKRDWLTFKAKYSHMTEYADLLRAEANGEDIEQLEIAS